MVLHARAYSTGRDFKEDVLGHWSEVRLGWDHQKHGYAMGELVAEMAACYLSQELRIPDGERLDNHARYLKSWLKEMRGDPSYIFRASTQASKVTDYLLSFVRKEEPADQVACKKQYDYRHLPPIHLAQTHHHAHQSHPELLQSKRSIQAAARAVSSDEP